MKKIIISTVIFVIAIAILISGFVFVISFLNSRLHPQKAIITQDHWPILIYGDSRTDHSQHQKIIEAMIQTNPSAVFHTGDLVEFGLMPSQWEKFNDITGPLISKVEFYPALGNHEQNSPLYFNNFELPGNERWYLVEKNNLYFIVLDSSSNLKKNSEQYQWLESTLQNLGEQKFVISVFHYPIFNSPSTSHPEDELGLQDSIVPLFEQYDVDLVFNGHVHAYERLFRNDIYYIITGGGGATLAGQVQPSAYSQKYLKQYHFSKLSVENDKLVVEVLDSSLAILDRFTVDLK